jgi:parallel beta-helix repeat protein
MLKKRIAVASFVALFLVGLINVTVSVNAQSGVIHVYEGQSIQAAIDAASDGYKIIVHAGTYHESLFVNKGLKILGSDAIIDLKGTSFETAIIVNVGGVTISGFTIRNIPTVVSAGAIHYPVPSYGVSGGLIENNVIYSGFYGIVLHGPSNIEVRNNQITAVDPIDMINAPNVVIKNNVVSSHRLEGDSAWLGAGIAMYESLSSGLIEGNMINSEYWGISISNPSEVEVRNNKVYTSYHGIVVDNVPNVVIEKNVVSAQATPTLPQPKGISLTGTFSGGSIKKNEINSEYVGISIDGQSDIEICKNKVSASYYGIDARQAPNMVIEKNVVSVHNLEGDSLLSEAGISVFGRYSTGLIEGNIIDSKYRGITINSGVPLQDIKIRKNTITAITSIVVNNAQNVIIEKNVVHSDDCGIVHINAINATIIDNEVYISKGTPGPSPPYWIGIFFRGTDSNIAENKVSGDFEYGISIGAYLVSDELYSTDNTVYKNRITGGITPNDIGVYLDMSTSENSVIKNKISGVDTSIADDGTGNIVIP